MKKFGILIAIMAMVCFAVTAFAAEVAVPTARGEDVVVPNSFLATADHYGEAGTKIVAVFHDRVPAKKEVAMQRQGDNWVIPGGRGADMHPAVKTADGKYHWARIELMWSTGADFVNMRPAGPCLHVN